MEKVKKNLPWILLFAWPLFLFRNLLINIQTHLIDWGDSAYIAWQIFMVRDKILTLQWSSLSEMNTHYPFPMSTFFSDSFIGQAIFAIPLFFIKNPVLLYNLLFFLTLFLNYLSSYLFFKAVFKNQKAIILATFFFNNSFFFFDQLIHLQTLCYFPILFMLYFLHKDHESKENQLNYFKAGILLGLQFYFSIYLGIFALFIFSIYTVTKIIWHFYNKKGLITIKNHIFNSVISAVSAAILIYPLYTQYQLFEQIYHQVRDINEILLNSTHITDFLFFIPNTLLTGLGPILKYQAYNRHLVAESIRFPGLVLILGTILAIFFQKRQISKNIVSFVNKYTFLDFFFFALLLIGVVFALGPRLNANGQYLEIPLPYLFFLNTIFVFSSIRLVHRWIFLALLALIYFSVSYYQKVANWLLVIIVLFFIFEAIPLSLKSTKKIYVDQGHRYLSKNTKENSVLIEFPFLNLEKNVPVDYETRILLASTLHKLQLFNGYTGLFIKDWGDAKIHLERFIPNNYALSLLQGLQIDYLKLNKQYLDSKRIKTIRNKLIKTRVFENSNTIIFKIPSNEQIKKANQNINVIKVNFIKNNPLTFGENDALIYLRLDYFNKSNVTITNIKQAMVKAEFYFYKQNKLIKKRVYYDLYPLFNFANSRSEHLIKFKETTNYDTVEVQLHSTLQKKTVLDKLLVNKN